MAALPELKQKPSGVYYVDLRSRGMGRVSLNTRDRAVARERLRELLFQGTPRPAAQPSRSSEPQVTMADLFDRAERTIWSPSEAKSQATIRSNVKILSDLIGHVPVAEMTYTRLEELVATLRARGYAPGTIKRKMDAVSRVLRMATRWTDAAGRPLLLSKPVMPSIRVSNLKDRVLSLAEEDAVFAAIERRRPAEPARQWRRFAALVRFLLDTGARLGEARATGPSDLDHRYLDDDTAVTFVTFGRYRTKNDKPRSVPLTAAVLRDLQAQTEAGDLGTVRGKEVYFPMTNGTAWYMWDNIRADVAAAGFDISDVTLHTLRHTCLSRLANGGMDLLRLQLWAGHSDPKITAGRYVHLSPDALAGGLDILQGSIGGNRANVIFTEAPANRAGSGTHLTH